MLEFKKFEMINKDDSPVTSLKFEFIDDELSEESLEHVSDKLKEYEIYLEYDCKGEFQIKYKKETIIEMIITCPSRKVPEGKKELEKFINRHVMDFCEYYSKMNFNNLVNNGAAISSS